MYLYCSIFTPKPLADIGCNRPALHARHRQGIFTKGTKRPSAAVLEGAGSGFASASELPLFKGCAAYFLSRDQHGMQNIQVL